MGTEWLRIEGFWRAVHTRRDGVKIYKSGRNLVTLGGMAHFVTRAAEEPEVDGVLAEMRLGSGAVTPLEADTVLASEIAASPTAIVLSRLDRTLIAQTTFTAAAPWDVKEVGLFASNPVGPPHDLMVARFLIQNVLLAITETLNITWRLVFGGVT